MSRCSSLYQALEKASANSSGFLWNRSEIARYDGSVISARSDVSITGGCLFQESCGAGTALGAAPPLRLPCLSPAGLSDSSHPQPKNTPKKLPAPLFGGGAH